MDPVPCPVEPQPDRLRDLQCPRCSHVDRHVDVIDRDRSREGGARRETAGDDDQTGQERGDATAGSTATETTHLTDGRGVHRSPNRTLGTARSASLPSSKKSRAFAPAAPASRFQGNIRTDALRSRTVAL